MGEEKAKKKKKSFNWTMNLEIWDELLCDPGQSSDLSGRQLHLLSCVVGREAEMVIMLHLPSWPGKPHLVVWDGCPGSLRRSLPGFLLGPWDLPRGNAFFKLPTITHCHSLPLSYSPKQRQKAGRDLL